MIRRRSPLTIVCFVALLVLGLVFALIGIVIIPMLPTLMLDVVIDPRDILDGPKREEVLSLLNKAWGNTGLVWSCAGLLIAAISGLGLWANRTSGRSSADDEARRQDE